MLILCWGRSDLGLERAARWGLTRGPAPAEERASALQTLCKFLRRLISCKALS